MSCQQGEAMFPPPLMDSRMEQGQAKELLRNTVNDGLQLRVPQKEDDTLTTVTTSGSIYVGSGSSQGQELSVIERVISRIEEVEIKDVLVKLDLGAASEGLEKLGAYVFANDENAVPAVPYTGSKTTQDEEFSLHLSRPTGTGSHQLELWIREVNIAVRGPSPLHIQTERAPTDYVMAFSPANRSDYERKPCLSSTDYPVPPRNGLAKPYSGSKRSSAKVTPKACKHGGGRLAEDTPSGNRFSQVVTPRVNNSQVFMANIEGQYKNLREELIRDPTFDAPPSSCDEDELEVEDEESECQSPLRRPQNETARIHSLVSGDLARNDPLKPLRPLLVRPPDFSAVRDPFSLGLLSTRSSGILSANSWSSSASSDSGASFIPAKGCGIFLCE